MADREAIKSAIEVLGDPYSTMTARLISAKELSSLLARAEAPEAEVERVALVIRDIKGGLNYDYMDFCRDAARAAIGALTPAQSNEWEDAIEIIRQIASMEGRTYAQTYWFGKARDFMAALAQPVQESKA
jgi:hypothetical protein